MFTAAEKPCNGRQAAVQQVLQDRIRSCCSVPGCLWAPRRTVQMRSDSSGGTAHLQ